jgi:hypothetical protein
MQCQNQSMLLLLLLRLARLASLKLCFELRLLLAPLLPQVAYH